MQVALTPGDLAPWAQVPFFNPPRQTVFTGTGGVLTIAQGNVNRTVLIISNNTSGIVYVTMDPTAQATQGIAIGTAFGSLILTAAQHGPLVTYPWYWVSVSLSFLTVLEVTANRWPNPQQYGEDGEYEVSLPYAIDPSDNDSGDDFGYYYRALKGAAGRLLHQ